jgi:hypothetical protein
VLILVAIARNGWGTEIARRREAVLDLRFRRASIPTTSEITSPVGASSTPPPAQAAAAIAVPGGSSCYGQCWHAAAWGACRRSTMI